MLILFDTQTVFKDIKEFKAFCMDLYECALSEDPGLSFDEFYSHNFLNPDNYIYDTEADSISKADVYFRKVYNVAKTFDIIDTL